MHGAIATGIPAGVTEADIAGERITCQQCGQRVRGEPLELTVAHGYFCGRGCAEDWVVENPAEVVRRAEV